MMVVRLLKSLLRWRTNTVNLVGQTKKTKFIALNAGYHGDTLGTVSVGGIQLFHQVFHNLLFKPLTLPSPGVYRDVADRDKAFEDSLAELERILNEEGDEITALVMEPLVQAAAGMLVMPHGYLKRVRELTEEHDVFLIVDEVATGLVGLVNSLLVNMKRIA